MDELTVAGGEGVGPDTLDQPPSRRIPAEHEELQLAGHCRGIGLQQCPDEAGAEAVALPFVRDDDPEFDGAAVGRCDREGVTDDLLTSQGDDGSVTWVGGSIDGTSTTSAGSADVMNRR